jgi:hypothetical protein
MPLMLMAVQAVEEAAVARIGVPVERQVEQLAVQCQSSPRRDSTRLPFPSSPCRRPPSVVAALAGRFDVAGLDFASGAGGTTPPIVLEGHDGAKRPRTSPTLAFGAAAGELRAVAADGEDAAALTVSAESCSSRPSSEYRNGGCRGGEKESAHGRFRRTIDLSRDDFSFSTRLSNHFLQCVLFYGC